MNPRAPCTVFLVLVSILGCITSPDVRRACFNDKLCVNVETAGTQEERARGLMYREQLGRDSGMLFVFEREDYYNFWMKNTLIPLDMIWIDADGRIVHVEHAMPCAEDPCPRYAPKAKALYVLEVNGGYTTANGIRVGDQVRFD